MSDTSPPSDLIALARAAAAAHGLWPRLVCAVVEQESAWNAWALRYEPAFFARYIQPLIDRGALTDGTEARARSFSWGLMQVMGQVVREQGLTDVPLTTLCEPSVGLEVGCRLLAAKLAAADGNVMKALLLWNGGADPGYPAAVLARTAHYASS